VLATGAYHRAKAITSCELLTNLLLHEKEKYVTYKKEKRIL